MVFASFSPVLQFSRQTLDSPSVCCSTFLAQDKVALRHDYSAACLAYTKSQRRRVTATFATQIELDDRGIAWIAGTKVKVTEVVLDKIA